MEGPVFYFVRECDCLLGRFEGQGRRFFVQVVRVQDHVYPSLDALGVSAVDPVDHGADAGTFFKCHYPCAIRFVSPVTFCGHGNGNYGDAGEGAQLGLATELVPFHIEPMAFRAHGPRFRREVAAVLTLDSYQFLFFSQLFVESSGCEFNRHDYDSRRSTLTTQVPPVPPTLWVIPTLG